MAKNNMIKRAKALIGSMRFNWKSLLMPTVIDKVADNKQTQIEKKLAIGLAVIVAGMMNVVLFVTALPDIGQALSRVLLVMFVYVGYCSFMNSFFFKKNNAGRKKKDKADTFERIFKHAEDYKTVDEYIRTSYSTSNKMSSPQCRALCEIIIDSGWVNDDSLAPLASLFIKAYQEFVSFSTARAVTIDKNYQAYISVIKKSLIPQTSKK